MKTALKEDPMPERREDLPNILAANAHRTGPAEDRDNIRDRPDRDRDKASGRDSQDLRDPARRADPECRVDPALHPAPEDRDGRAAPARLPPALFPKVRVSQNAFLKQKNLPIPERKKN